MMVVVQAEDMAGERHALENCVIEMNTKGSQIMRWLAEKESKTTTGVSMSVHVYLHSSVAPQLLFPRPTLHIPCFLFDALRVAE